MICWFTKVFVLLTLAFVFFGYGLGVGLYQWPPYSALQAIKNAAKQRLDISKKQVGVVDITSERVRFFVVKRRPAA